MSTNFEFPDVNFNPSKSQEKFSIKSKLDQALSQTSLPSKSKNWKSSTFSTLKPFHNKNSIASTSSNFQIKNSEGLNNASYTQFTARSTSQQSMRLMKQSYIQSISSSLTSRTPLKIQLATPEILIERLSTFKNLKEETLLMGKSSSSISQLIRSSLTSFEILFTTLHDRAIMSDLEMTTCDKGLESFRRAISVFAGYEVELKNQNRIILELSSTINTLTNKLKAEDLKKLASTSKVNSKRFTINKSEALNELAEARSERENEMIKHSMAQFERYSKSEALEKEMLENYKNYQLKMKAMEEELTTKKSIISRFSVTLAAHQQTSSKLESDKSLLETKLKSALDSIADLKAQLSKMTESTGYIREIACMQKEEMESFFSINGFTKNQLGAMKAHYDTLMSKYKRLLEQVTLPSEKEADNNLKSSFDHFMKKSLRQSGNKSKDDDGIELCLLLPSFSSYLEKTLNSRSWNATPIMRITSLTDETSSFDNKFLATIRGIFDSKFNEFLLYPDYRSFSRFPEFVYSWLGRFGIDDSFKVAAQDVTSLGNLDVRRCEFFQFFSQKIIDKHWESLVFKEFLLNGSPLDEVYFYLFCRNLIFQGPQMSNPSNGFSFIHYVSLKRAFEVIDWILVNFSDDIKDFLKTKFSERAKSKTRLVDGGFVLSILLDYYREERRNRKILIKKKVDAIGGTLDIDSFSLLLHELCPETTELDVIQLFNLAYNIGNGKINFQALYIVLSEFNFFIKCLKISFPIQPPDSKDETNLNGGGKARLVLQDFKKNEKDIYEVHQVCSSFGVESLYEEISSYQKILLTSFHMPLHSLRGQNAVGSYLQYHSKLFQIRNHELYLRMLSSDIEDEEVIKSDEIIFNYLYSLLVMLKKKDHVRELEKNSMAKKIQKWVHNRFSKWFKLMLTIFSKKNDLVIESHEKESQKLASKTKPKPDSKRNLNKPSQFQ